MKETFSKTLQIVSSGVIQYPPLFCYVTFQSIPNPYMYFLSNTYILWMLFTCVIVGQLYLCMY